MMRARTLQAALVAIGLVAQSAEAQLPDVPEGDRALIADFLGERVDQTPEEVVYVAPDDGPDGRGTRDDPRRDLIAAFSNARAGTALYLLPGTYDMPAIRDRFGHDDSALFTQADGAPGRPIVLRTVPGSAEEAVLDWGYDNDSLGWRQSAVIVTNDYWVFEHLEMRRARRRLFWVGGYHNTFRRMHLHHVNTDGGNNEGIFLINASGGETNTIVLQNHLHHAGNIDESDDTFLDRGGVNGGCVYTETRLTYDSTEPAAGLEASVAEFEAGIQPPDSHVFLVGNRVHHCYYGLGQKTHSRGPYFFLSNHISEVSVGIMGVFSENVIRNNVIEGANIQLGRAWTDSALRTYLKMTGNGARSVVSNNTIVGGQLLLRGGWEADLRNNLIVDGPPIGVARNQYSWYEGGAWPGIRGEFLLGDFTEGHPFYDAAPPFMRELQYERARLRGNCYTEEPAIEAADFTQPSADITGRIFDEDYTVLSEGERATLFVDESAGDFQLANALPCGSQIGWNEAPAMPDAGPSTPDAGAPDSGTRPDGGAGPDASPADAGMGSAPPASGCGLAARTSPAALVGFALAACFLRRRRRARG